MDPKSQELRARLDRWNERYARGGDTHHFVPSRPLSDALVGITPGRALDLACGAGRHSLFLASHGWNVVAVDGASTAIQVLREEAHARGLSGQIETHVANLMSKPREFGIEPASYDLICDFYFLDRTLFDDIRLGVRPGGHWIAAIHATGEEATERLLRKGELRSVVSAWGWTILVDEEGPSHEGGHQHQTAMIVARRPQ